MKKINSLIDHTNLKIDATEKDIERLCEETVKYNFRGVCVNSLWIPRVSGYLANKTAKIISVCDFPLGSSLITVRRREAELIMENGAEEIDIVMQISLLKSKKYKEIEEDIRGIVKIAHPGGKVKVIIEAPILSSGEILSAVKIAESAGADFIKSGTGTNGPATVFQIRQIKKATSLPIKAAGGIRSMQTALKFIRAGAAILGSSSGEEIIKEFKKENFEK
jgi:deoxyribose-phosphate aldolase